MDANLAGVAANPIGVPVDPEMVEAHQAGASSADLHPRAFAGELLLVQLFDPRVPLD